MRKRRAATRTTKQPQQSARAARRNTLFPPLPYILATFDYFLENFSLFALQLNPVRLQRRGQPAMVTTCGHRCLPFCPPEHMSSLLMSPGFKYSHSGITKNAHLASLYKKKTFFIRTWGIIIIFFWYFIFELLKETTVLVCIHHACMLHRIKHACAKILLPPSSPLSGTRFLCP